ncbi:MAG: FadR family transcriptional regulator [Desulfovibrio sp.]|jgi:DNA-binding FadR family transcriptional regulator|nr:FadR family transcriptional regulator [Desulfovibrio sp.]
MTQQAVVEGHHIVRRRQLVDEVITCLHELLASGQYKEGDKIPTEAKLGEMFTVSRTTVREAIKVLANTGMLEVQQGRGTFVAKRCAGKEPLERRLIRATEPEVYEARLLLETDIARLAAQRRTDEDLRKMRWYMEESATALKRGDINNYLSCDVQFHVAVAVASKNAVLVDVYSAFTDVLHDSLRRSWEQNPSIDIEQRRAAILQSHEKIYQAIYEADPDNAARITAGLIGEMYKIDV